MLQKKHIAFVTTFPPSRSSLNEYAYHFVRALREKVDEVERLTLLVEELPQGEQYTIEGDSFPIDVVPCWEFNRIDNPVRILRAVKRCQPDVVIFNLQFATFGDKKSAAAIGLTTPSLIRRSGFKSLVLLHNIMETVDLDSAGFSKSPIMSALIRGFGFIATKFILDADLVVLTIPKYIDILRDKYAAKNVLLAPHGTFEIPPLPNFERGDGPAKIMTFGKFGTYKKVEGLIEAVQKLRNEGFPDTELVIAGTDNPNVKGYLANTQAAYGDLPWVTYTGYVLEEDVPRIFGESTAVVFPYTSTTGSSGVLHQAGSYGKAAVLPNLGDFAELITDEGYTGEFFEPDSVNSLADAIKRVIGDDEHRRSIAEQNYHASCGLPISDVVDWYLIYIDQLLEDPLQENLVTMNRENDVTIFTLSGRLDAHIAPIIREHICDALSEDNDQFVINMRDVSFVDESGIKTLEWIHESSDGGLHLCHTRQAVRIILELATGDRLPLYNTQREAIAASRQNLRRPLTNAQLLARHNHMNAAS